MCTKKEWKQNNQTFSQTKSFVNSLNSNNEKKLSCCQQNKTKKDKEIRMEKQKKKSKDFLLMIRISRKKCSFKHFRLDKNLN